MPSERHAECPSCRAQIPLDADGNPEGEGVAHFSIHDGTQEKQADASPAPTEPPPSAPGGSTAPTEEQGGAFARFDSNLKRLLGS